MAKINSINNSANALTIDPGASGDSFTQFDINGTGEFRIGVDDDDSDKFKISQGNALGSNDCIVVESTGEVTMPLQSAFMAYLGTQDSNVTGDNTIFYLGSGNALTKLFDQNNDFVTTGTFTAPKTAKYTLGMNVQVSGLISSHTNYVCAIVTTGNTFTGNNLNPYAASTGGVYGSSMCVTVDMTAADTATFYVRVLSGTKVCEVDSANNVTNVYGFLAC